MMSNSMEPGTGTQIAVFASPPEDEDNPNTYRIDGTTWACGREYWDALTRDLVTLVKIVGRSSWCDTKEPEDCPPILVFEQDPKPHVRNPQFRVDPVQSPDPDEWDSAVERFTLRSISDPAGIEREVWPGADK